MERYKLQKVVGDGTFGTVYKATNRATGEICAIKKMKKTFSSWDECLNLREIKSLRKFNSPFIVKLKEVFRVNDELHLVFEFMQENIYELIKDRTVPLPESQIRNIISQVLEGLVYMHRHGFFHRDLKPENLMISETICKIADFGLAKEIRSKPPFTDYVSTRWYRAPEILMRSTSYNSPVDLFAVGCIMAELYTLRPLAAGTNENDQILKLCMVLGTPTTTSWPDGFKLASEMGFKFPNYSPPGLENITFAASSDAIELMNALLQWDPQKRPTAAESLKFKYFDLKDDAAGPEKSVKNASKYLNGSSRITGNSSKGKWSFGFENSNELLPKIKEPEKAKPKLEPPSKATLFPLISKNASRKVSRERVPFNQQESPIRNLAGKLLTNPVVSPRSRMRLPPISCYNSSGGLSALPRQSSRNRY